MDNNAPAVAAPQARLVNAAWRIRHSAWMLTAFAGFGIFTWIGFLYIGLRTRKLPWLVAAGAYCSAAIAMFVVPAVDGGRSGANIGGGIVAITWMAGIVHAFLVRRSWLQWRAQHDPWQLEPTSPPSAAMTAPPSSKPPLRESDALSKINRATHEELSALPWFDAERTVRVLAERELRGQFYSLEEFAAVAKLTGEQFRVLQTFLA